MEESGKRPLLYKYFKHSAQVMLQEYQRSKNQSASTNIGFNREFLAKNFLKNVVPPRLSVQLGGEIWDSKGGQTGQLDIVIIRDDCPSLMFGGSAKTYIGEGVFSVIEVKSNLTSTKLHEALGQLNRVKALCLETTGTEVVYDYPHILRRPFRCVFAYQGSRLNTLLDELNKPEHKDIADLLCVLNRGAILTKGLMKWKGEEPFYLCEGKAAALAWLYYHLVSFSGTFLQAGADIKAYFRPLSNWHDSAE